MTATFSFRFLPVVAAAGLAAGAAALSATPAALAQSAPQQKSAPAKAAPKAAPKTQSKSQPKSNAAPKGASGSPAAAAPQVGDSQPRLLGQYGEWGAFTASPNGKKLCFALGKPRSATTNPPNRPRDQPYFFISTRPADNVRSEISLVVGYPFRPGSDATAEIGSASFAMYTENDGAWIKNVADEARMLDAMRKGAEVVVKGMSGRGTRSTDTFSLKGLSQAVDRAEQECR